MYVFMNVVVIHAIECSKFVNFTPSLLRLAGYEILGNAVFNLGEKIVALFLFSG